MADYIKRSSNISVFKPPKGPKLKFAKLPKISIKKPKLKSMEQYMGPKTTGHSQMEGRLKIAASKRKIAKAAVKKASKAKTGLKAKFAMM